MKLQNQSKKAVLYARKSTESEDKQVQSIDDQIRAMKRVAKDEGLEIVEILSESKSAKEPNVRVQFGKMMKNISAGKYSIILAWDTSRSSRNAKDGGDLQWLLDSGALSGIRTHEKWYRENDELLFTIENSMNSRFVKELKAKVKRGMDSKADKGDFPACAPIGYLNDRLEKKIIKDPEMWDKVSMLWRKALTGTYTVAELTRIADEELRIKKPLKKRTGGNPLCHNAVRGILTNPFYAGKFRWSGKIYNGNYPPMVTESEFERMQEILKPGHASRPQKEPYQFLLRGMLTCAECGYAIVTERKFKKLKDGTVHEHRYCRCSDKCPGHCKNRSIYVREEDLIQQIKDELSKYTIDEKFFKLAVEALAEEDEIEVSKQNERIANYNKQIATKKNELDNLRRSVYRGLITDNAFFLSEQKSLEKDIEVLEKEREKVTVVAHDWRKTAMDIFMFARYAKEDFDSDDWEKKRAVIKQLGADLKLSGRTIQFTPVKYLVPIEKAHPELKDKKELVRTNPQQMKKDPGGGLISEWYARHDLNV
ncbi:recombinase family protein [Candidatus Saccharibacteria bacterium]|nr:recombinase family protein [Candidatus Saccharibacteria bacterium]